MYVDFNSEDDVFKLSAALHDIKYLAKQALEIDELPEDVGSLLDDITKCAEKGLWKRPDKIREAKAKFGLDEEGDCCGGK